MLKYCLPIFLHLFFLVTKKLLVLSIFLFSIWIRQPYNIYLVKNTILYVAFKKKSPIVNQILKWILVVVLNSHSSRLCVVLPERSQPSKTKNTPRLLVFIIVPNCLVLWILLINLVSAKYIHFANAFHVQFHQGCKNILAAKLCVTKSYLLCAVTLRCHTVLKHL